MTTDQGEAMQVREIHEVQEMTAGAASIVEVHHVDGDESGPPRALILVRVSNEEGEIGFVLSPITAAHLTQAIDYASTLAQTRQQGMDA